MANKDGIRIRYTYNQYTPPLKIWGRVDILAEPGALLDGEVKKKTEWYELLDVR